MGVEMINGNFPFQLTSLEFVRVAPEKVCFPEKESHLSESGKVKEILFWTM